MLKRLKPWAEAIVTTVFILIVIAALFVLIAVAKFVFMLLMGTILLVCVIGFIYVCVLDAIKQERKQNDYYN